MTIRLSRHGVAALCIWIALFCACQRPESPAGAVDDLPSSTVSAAAAPRNAILISIDSLRWDHVGSYGYEPPTTPALDRFAAEGTRFSNAYATSSWTLPSHASMFTGLYADSHGLTHEKARLDPKTVTLAERLREAGYATGAVVCAPLLATYFGLDDGFDKYDDELVSLIPLRARRMKVAPDVTSKALSWVDARRDKPFFLFLHYWDVHHDYNPPDEYVRMFDPDYKGEEEGLDITIRTDVALGMKRRDLRHIVALYDGEIRYTDDHLGALLAGLRERGLTDDTMIWVTADHGEEFLEHGQMAHKKTCYEESVRIPMLARIPWLGEQRPVIDDAVSLVDLYPTLLSLLGVDAGETPLQGVDLSPTLRDDRPLERRFLTMETAQGKLPGRKAPVEWAAMLTPEKKKLHAVRTTRPKRGTPRFSLFDLGVDPGEKTDQGQQATDAVRRLKKEFREIKGAHTTLRDALGMVLESPEDLDPNLAETLRGLGYLQ